ncbi:glutathione-dependent formaldehyde-activating [Immersiella caudata]|uniref:Glutathione-dependent formaldehyde-activating n=1 Tax=Immersiella caudata TaxID=314043 RepID=A0AA40BUR1_9PEZI|nr:glutathione-dependent formaldehyde-activating [Immersiella caudata]
MSSSPPTKTYTFSCHCALIRFSITGLNPSNPQATKCNCSICLKSGRISISADKNKDFTLLSPASLDEVPSYQFGERRQKHCFCRVCGIHCFAYGSFEWEGKTMNVFSFNVLALDAEPDQGFDLRGLKLGYWDGKGDKYLEGPAEKPAAGGVF